MTTEQPTLDQQLDALTASANQLAALVTPLTPDELRQPAYPSEWTVADVLSHIGSGAVITRLRLSGEVDAQPIWDEWNAKSPDQQAADALAADQALLERLNGLSPAEQAQRFAMGPFDLDLRSYLALRLNEHVVHTWDVAVTLDDTATISPEAAAFLIDSLPMIAGFAGKPTGAERTITVHTDAPHRHLEIALRPDGVALSTATDETGAGSPDLQLPGEALVRLVQGRLDPDHSPTLSESQAAELSELRKVFPGF
jgi:uncharacterized protein (TIGR03083 family)